MPCDVRIEKYKAEDVPKNLLPILRPLTLPTGLMWSTFDACRSRHSSYYGIVHIAYIGDKIVGWSLRWHIRYNRRWTLYIFVHGHHRRKGVGSTLAEHASKYVRRSNEIGVVPWDKRSRAFFDVNLEKNQKLKAR